MMSDRDVLDAIKKHIQKLDKFMQTQGKAFKFFDGKTMLTAEQMLKKLNGDKKFRKLIVEMVIAQTVEILGKEPE